MVTPLLGPTAKLTFPSILVLLVLQWKRRPCRPTRRGVRGRELVVGPRLVVGSLPKWCSDLLHRPALRVVVGRGDSVLVSGNSVKINVVT